MRIAMVTGSTRPGRNNIAVSRCVLELAAKRRCPVHSVAPNYRAAMESFRKAQEVAQIEPTGDIVHA